MLVTASPGNPAGIKKAISFLLFVQPDKILEESTKVKETVFFILATNLWEKLASKLTFVHII